MQPIIIKDKAELNALIDERLEERRKGNHAITKVLGEFEREYEKFNTDKDRESWEEWERRRSMGMRSHAAYNARSAISGLIRAHYRVKSTSQIPENKADEVRELVNNILSVTLPKEA